MSEIAGLRIELRSDGYEPSMLTFAIPRDKYAANELTAQANAGVCSRRHSTLYGSAESHTASTLSPAQSHASLEGCITLSHALFAHSVGPESVLPYGLYFLREDHCFSTRHFLPYYI